jgi:hypothetical protein
VYWRSKLLFSQLAACVEAVKIDDPTRIVILSGLCEGSAFAACPSPPTIAIAKAAHANAHSLFFSQLAACVEAVKIQDGVEHE